MVLLIFVQWLKSPLSH